MISLRPVHVLVLLGASAGLSWGQTPITLSSSLNPSTFGQTVILSAQFQITVASGTTVTFRDAGVSIGTATTNANGLASFPTSTLAVASHNLTATAVAVTGGNLTSNTVTQVVNKANTTTTFSSAPNPSSFGQAVTLTATVSPAGALGTVTFVEGNFQVGAGSVNSSGVATFTTSTLAVGSHRMAANYAGSANFNGSSGAGNQTVNQASSTTTVSASPNPGTFGANVTISATVPAAATGTVTFFDGSTQLGQPSNVTNVGVSNFSTSNLAIGNHSLTGVYSGDNNFIGSTSQPFLETISKLTTRTTLAVNPTSATTGQTVTLTATVTASSGATGNVTFFDNGSALGTSNLSGGSAVFTTTTLPVGTHSMTATYQGDATNAPSTSAPAGLTVTQGTVSTTTTLTASPSPATSGQAVTFTATVTPATATGTVTFSEGPNTLGSGTLSNGTATFSTSTLAVGTHSIIASYGGDTTDAASTSAVFSLTVNQATQVTLTALPNPSTFGQSVTLTATVTPTNSTGTVSFRDGGAQIGAGNLSASGIATFSTTALTVGSHTLTAVLGNATSNAITQTVGKAATTTSLGLSQTTSTPGQSVTLTATVIPATATGSVAFFDGSTQIGSGTVNNGTATMATSALAVGSHSLSAVYGGDGNFNGSTGTASLAVGQGSSATSLTATPNPASSGQVVTLTATVVPASATGTITFKDGGTTIGSGTLSNGIATTTISTLTVGSHSLTAAYGGDTVVGASTSTAVVEVINQTVTATTTTLLATPSPANAGQVVTLNAVVAPTSATGTVTFKDFNATIGTANLINGAASTTISTLSPGSHSLTATYSGDTANSPSTSAVVVVIVNPVTAGVILTASPNPANAGQPVTLSAVVNPSSATGIITFRDGANSIGTGTISSGSANLVISTLAVGSHSLTASYSGDASNGASTSTAVVEVINQSNSGVTLTATPNPATLGQTVTLTATVLPSTATGTITIFDSATASPVGGTATLSNGVATITTSTLKVGTHALQAFYSGDANTGSGQSNFVTEVINAASTTPTTTTLTVSPQSSTAGQTVTMTATVTPSGATGNVTFRDGSAGLGTGTLNGGTATFSTTNLTGGIHTLSAAYPGDGNFAASNSNPINQTVTSGTAACIPFPASFVPFGAGAAVSKPNSAGDLVVVGSMSAANFTTFQNLALPTGANQQFCGTVFLAPNLPAVAYVPTAAERAGDFSPFAGLLIDPASNTAFPGGVIPASRIPGTFAWRIAAALQNSTTAITATPTTPAAGQTVTLSAIVTPFSATGTVTFLEGTTTIGTGTLSGGTATTTISTLTTGVHSITASYGGDANNGPSTSTAVTVTVTAGGALTGTRTVLTVAPTSSAFGAPVTLTATVTPSTATGSVTFLDSAGSGTAILGTQTLSNGTATLTTPNLAPGTHALTASYGGDSKNGASTSTPVTVTITGTLTATRTVLTVAPTSSTVGQAVTFTAAVTPAGATGTVTFLDGSATLGTAPLSGGTATLTNSSLAAGTHSLTASYGGDANNAASTSTAVTETVTAPTALRISAPTALPAAFVGTAYSQTFSATGGTGPFTWALLSGTTELTMSPAGVLSGTPRTAGTFTLGVNVKDSAGQANGAAMTLTVEPAVPPLNITVTAPTTITTQPAPTASLGQSYPVALSATFRLTFAPNAAGLPANFNNSAVQFFGGGTTSAAVAIPANSTTPVALPAVQLGDVAGVITVQLNSLTIAGTGQGVPLPTPAPTVAITVPRLAPIIVPGSVKLTNITSSAFQVTLVGSSTPRDLTSATVTFSAASGTQLNGTTQPVSLTSAAATWFDPANAAGVASGGSFTLTLPFAYSGDPSALGSVSVILTNSVSASTAVAGGR